MTFTDRAILVGLVALVIPLLLHLLGRRRARKVELPTARFAEGAHASTRGRLWVKRLGLLALRLAAVALVVLALAGPHVGGGSAPGGRWILVLDASASMRARHRDGRTAFDRSRTRLGRILQALAEEAEVTLALTDGRGAAGSPEEVRRTLEAMTDPGWRADTLGRTIREVLAAPGNAAEATPAHIILATDATQAALADVRPGAFAKADVDVTILATSPAGPNARVGLPRVTVSPAQQGRGHVLVVAVEARAAEPGGQVTVRLDLADPALRATSRSFPGRGRATFRQPVPGPGPWQGRVRLPADDALPADNVRYFTAAAAQAVHVLVVDAAGEPGARVRSADLVEAAFAGETDAPKHVTRRPAAEVRRAGLASADLIFWVGPKPPAQDGLLAGPRPPVVWVPADAAPPASALAEALGLRLEDAET
ncbi:MAG: BatA domain-containing protein, partial [Planctomycetota bacterium]|nr:BatA domain-containing protein [Planctomycetota bacterium]